MENPVVWEVGSESPFAKVSQHFLNFQVVEFCLANLGAGKPLSVDAGVFHQIEELLVEGQGFLLMAQNS